MSRSAAALSYFLILTLFPLLMCINYFIGLFHLDLEQLVRGLDQVLPDEALTVIVEYLGYVSQAQSPALLLASLATIVLSASAGMRTLFQAMDELYQARRRTPFRRMVASVVLSLLFLLTIYLSVVVIFTGDWFFWFIGMSSRYALVYGSLASLVILLVWLYLCGNILLLGAVVGWVWTRQLHRSQ